MPTNRPSRPTLLVDTYNVLHVTGILPPDIAGIDAPALARLIARSRYANRPTWLVCDGAPPGSRRSGGMLHQRIPGIEAIELAYAGPNRDADSAIERLIAQSSAPKKILVVSSDRRILKSARKRKCAAMPSEPFLAQLARDHANPKPPGFIYPEFALNVPLDPTQIKRWRDRMGLTDINIPASRDPLAKSPKTPPTPPTSKSKNKQPPTPPQDPLLNEALREWDGRLNLDDLDMSQWLSDPDQR